MAKGGGVDATLNRFFQFFTGMGRPFLQTKFLAVGSFFGHLPMKKISDRTYRLDSKIRRRMGASVGGGGGREGGNHPHGLFLPIFLTMKMNSISTNFDMA